MSKNGQAIHIDSVPLGDRTTIQSISVLNGKIEINMLVKSDPNAPTATKKTVTYMLKNDRLVQTENVPKPAPKPAKPGPAPKKTEFTRNLS